jgi:hypothetical protein
MKSVKKKMVRAERNIYDIRGFENYNQPENHRADAGMILQPSFIKENEKNKEKNND